MLGRAATILLLVVTGGCSYLTYCILRRKHFNRNQRSNEHYEDIPKSWKHVGYVAALNLYPLKAGYYLTLDRAFCDSKGMKEIVQSDGTRPLSDRCFIVFNRCEEKYITNITYNQLIRVKVKSLGNNLIEFQVHNDTTHRAPLVLNMNDVTRSTRTIHKIKMYEKDTVHAVDCGPEASQWFSAFLLGEQNDDIRLGYDCDEQRRLNGTIYEKYKPLYNEHISNEDMGTYSYFASYMVMNQISVQDLNQRLNKKGEPSVSMQHFRGNIILNTLGEAYEEDEWKWLRINQVTLRVMKPCTRCIMTCINPETGVRNAKTEPLVTLRSYRQIKIEEARKLEKNCPCLGLYCGLYTPGVVRTGDLVYVEAGET